MAGTVTDYRDAVAGIYTFASRGCPAGARRQGSEDRGLEQTEGGVRSTNAERHLATGHPNTFIQSPHLAAGFWQHPAKQGFYFVDATENAVAFGRELNDHFRIDAFVPKDGQSPVQFVISCVPGEDRACDLKIAWCSHVLMRLGVRRSTLRLRG